MNYLELHKKCDTPSKHPFLNGCTYFGQHIELYFFIKIIERKENGSYDIEIKDSNSNIYFSGNFLESMNLNENWYLVEDLLIKKTEDILKEWI